METIRFTDRARTVMETARDQVRRFDHEYLGTEHILLGQVLVGAGAGARVLARLGLDPDGVRCEIEKLIKHGPGTPKQSEIPQTPRARNSIAHAVDEARTLDDDIVGTEHLLLGLLREHDCVAAQVLRNVGADLDEGRAAILDLQALERGGPSADDA